MPSVDLSELLLAAAEGRYPAADGGWSRAEPWRSDLEAVVAFTGHAVLVVDRDRSHDELAALQIDGLGGAHHPRVVSHLAGAGGWIDSLDLVLLSEKRVSPERSLVPRPDLADEPRARYAAGLRERTVVYGFEERQRRAVAVFGRGLGGLTELGFELEPERRGQGEGTDFIARALGAVDDDEPVVAAVAPGNAASLRALLRAGFRPVASVQLFRRG